VRFPSRAISAVLLFGSAAPLLAQCPDGTPPPCGAPRANAPTNSVAVLTFENLARDTSAQYLAEGLADQIFTRLGGVARLTMISRAAVRRLRNPEALSVQQIGRSLSASYLVSGSIRAAGGRVRVNVEALRATTGAAIWSAAYDRSGDDLIGLEEAIATEVAAGVAGRLTPQERQVLQVSVTANSHAYESFLRGNVLLARRSAADLRAAIAAYQSATTADPGFTSAWARMAYVYALCPSWRCGDNDDSLLRLSRQAAARALQLDPRSSDAWMGRGEMLMAWSNKGEADSDDSLLASLAAFRRAVELNPRSDEAWHQYGATLRSVSDSASLAALHRALVLDPARAVTYVDLSTTYWGMGRVDRASAALDTASALEPDSPFHILAAVYYMAAGDTAGAIAAARPTPGLFWGPPIFAAFVHDSAAIRTMEARVARATCEGAGDAVAGANLMYLLWTARRELAVQRLVRCGPSLWVRWQLRWPVLAPLADDPRIQTLRAEADRIFARARW
jgi:TolB-like protein